MITTKLELKTLIATALLLFLFSNSSFASGVSPTAPTGPPMDLDGGDNCLDAVPFCTGEDYYFPNATGTVAPDGPDYGCLGSEPNPIWYYMKIAESGVIQIDIAQWNNSGTGIDVDFALWGPFDELAEGCSDVMSGNLPPLQCSYSPDETEVIGLGTQGGDCDPIFGFGGDGCSTPPEAQEGEYYILLLTNYNGSPGGIALTQSNEGDSGAGATDCSIVEPCDFSVEIISPIHTCEGGEVDLENAVGANSDPSINTFYSSANDAQNKENELSSSVVNEEGDYYIRAEYADSVECYQVSKITVVFDGIDASFSLTDFCEGENNQATDINTPGGTFSFVDPPSDGAEINPQTGEITNGVGGTTYIIEYSVEVGECSEASVSSVVVNKTPEIDVPNQIDVCIDGTVTLSAGNPDGASISWDNDIEDGESYVSTEEGEVIYTVTAEKNGCENSKEVKVVTHDNLQPDFEADEQIGCTPFEVTFTSNYDDNMECLWDFGDGQTSTECSEVTHLYDQPGEYDVSLYVSNNQGCEGDTMKTNFIEVVENPTADFVANPSVVDVNNPVVNFENNSSNATDYTWDFGDNSSIDNTENPTHSYDVEESGTYTVTLYATNSTGCIDSTTQTVGVLQPDPEYKIPNIFTPNGDGENDDFKLVHYANVKSFDVVILNRWGNPVFESDKVNFEWNGKVGNDGAECADGVYFYKMNFYTHSGKELKEYGYVHLVRTK